EGSSDFGFDYRERLRGSWDERRPAVRINRLSGLWVGTLAAFLILSVLAAVRAADWSYGADTGTFVQIILDAFGGMYNGVELTTHYRFHWSPDLVLLWPDRK